MTINITARIRNAMVGLALGLCALFAMLIFLLVYVIEDRVFVNQLKAEQESFEALVEVGEPSDILRWRPKNGHIRYIDAGSKLPDELSKDFISQLSKAQGVHEYFDDDRALFVAHNRRPDTNQAYYLVYDVKDQLAVRDAKFSMFVLIGGLTLLIALLAVWGARRLANKALAPVSRLTKVLKNNDLDDLAIDLAKEFSKDEVGILTRELGLALANVRESAKREYDFNRAVSHELRSPIQVAKSAAELLELQSLDGDSDIKRPISRLKRSVQEMTEIAEAFLWLASKRIISSDEMCAASALQSALSELPAAFATHELVITLEPSIPISYPLPKMVLLVIVRNLVRNAITHGGRAQIRVLLAHDRIAVSNQLDISAEVSEQASADSFGIGLSIVQRICERFGCELDTGRQGHDQYCSQVVFVAPDQLERER